MTTLHLEKQDSFYKKLLSLWVIVYVLLYMFTSQFSPDFSPGEKFVLWFGKNIVHLPDLKKITMTGSGDTTYDYVFILLLVYLSAILALVIAAVDNKRKNYRPLYLFTIVLARYYIAFTMLVYGFAKVFEGQFPALQYYSLEKKFGDMSPMGVLWTFMETSRAYTFFGGLMEVIGGVLLLFRRTKTFGALFSMTVMINVAILNFTYDVPVKLFSTHVVLLCVFILSFEWQKLYNFFILHKKEVLDYNRLRVKKKWMQITLRSVKILIIAYLAYSQFISPLLNQQKDTVPLEGAYTTRLFVLNTDTLPYAIHDSVRWNKMYIAYREGINVIRKENEFSWYNNKLDTAQKTMLLHTYNDTSAAYAQFRYTVQNDTLLLQGHIKGDSTTILFTRKTKKDYPLLNRGFHWINEYPYNR